MRQALINSFRCIVLAAVLGACMHEDATAPQSDISQTGVSGQRGFDAGVYDLTAQITRFDPAWGDFTGYRYTGTLNYSTSTAGTWDNFRFVDATGQPSDWVHSGTISVYTDFAGRVVAELASNDFHFSLISPARDLLDPRVVTGTFGCCGHISGVFVARRR